MAMHHQSRSLIALIAALSILLVLPMAAGARGLQIPHPTIGFMESWLGAAFDWFQGALSSHVLGSGHHSPGPLASIQKEEVAPPPAANQPAGGSCVDPMGGRYPPPCIGD